MENIKNPTVDFLIAQSSVKMFISFLYLTCGLGHFEILKQMIDYSTLNLINNHCLEMKNA